ncbi:MAG TPA: triose-phosphate isomerase [Acidimicrobiales bacterium]|nr:triose-phosphate isomerase [Acidimicrobiales bacterium]
MSTQSSISDVVEQSGSNRLLVAGNWKMNHSHLDAIQVIRKLSLRLAESNVLEKIDVSVHPSFTALRSAQTIIESEGTGIWLGAQNCHFEDSGAYTGEVSASMLAKLNVSLVIVGHSERRQLLGETDEMVRLKSAAVLRNKMTPIICVGETQAERDAGETVTRITEQVEALLEGSPVGFADRVIIAYEPIWAIGTGSAATPEDAQSACSLIRETVRRFSPGGSESLRLLYGGSVKASTAQELILQPDVGGFLVGGASLDPDEFAQLVLVSAGANRAGSS